MSDELKQIDNEKVPGEKQGIDFEKRRKLLKASAAVPLVATLTTGTAAATSALACYDRTEQPLPGAITCSNPVDESASVSAFRNSKGHFMNDSGFRLQSCDEAVRIRVQEYQTVNGNYYYKLSDGLYDSDGNNSYTLTCESIANDNANANANANAEVCYICLSIENSCDEVVNTQWVYVTVDFSKGSTNYLSAWPKPSSGHPLYQSCLTSLEANISSVNGNLL